MKVNSVHLHLTVQIAISPEKIDDLEFHYTLICHQLNIDKNKIGTIELQKRSIDARKKNVKYILSYLVYLDEIVTHKRYDPNYKNVTDAIHQVHIIGSGPAGLFAALTCLQLGIKPILFERGKDVRSRRRDIALLSRDGIVDPDSNYCFGEGGAGTYSDGKLYTRSKKRGSLLGILQMLVHHGAEKDILIDAHPHIGTNKLPKLIQNIREEILIKGGEVHFGKKLTDFFLDNNGCISNIKINNEQIIPVENLVLATGHSSRDIFHLIKRKKIKMEFKPFALGVRIEHQQKLINEIQYGSKKRSEFLPPASYSLAYNNGERSVYSFCMCPGGIIAPCSTEKKEVVTNGWSPSKRNNEFANAGIVSEVKWSDLSEFHQYGSMAGIHFQQKIEQSCFEIGGGNQVLPAQRLMDFLNNKVSDNLPKTSYQPGVVSADLTTIFPEFVYKPLKEGLLDFGRKMKGFLTNDAILHASETRTSSPVRIPRNDELEHPEVFGLYPCGEGAGYAGGIISAAMDGIKCIKAIDLKISLSKKKVH